MFLLDKVSFGYSPSAPLFQDFSWVGEPGDAWAVIGPSGCGKSTLLSLLAGLRFPSTGRILIDGQELTRPRPHTGLIIQDYGLLPWATVRQNAELGIRVRSFYGPDGTHAPRQMVPAGSVDAWLQRLGLSPYAAQYPAQISGGQRQRTAIARTLVLQPDLLLMDEPFSSLDAPTREGLQGLVLELQAEQRLTLVVVTHAIEEAAFLGRKILLLGLPPTCRAEIIENPGVGLPGFRDQAEYHALVKHLRQRMESL